MILDDLYRHNALSYRDHPAIIYGERTITYGEYYSRSKRLANALAAGDFVIGHVDPVDLGHGDRGHLAGECGHSGLLQNFPYLGQTGRGYGKGGRRGERAG